MKSALLVLLLIFGPLCHAQCNGIGGCGRMAPPQQNYNDSCYCEICDMSYPCAEHAKHVHKPRHRHHHHVVHKPVTAPTPVAVIEEAPPPTIIERLPANTQCGNKALSCFEKFMKGRKFAIDPLPACMQVFVNAQGYMRIDEAPEFEERILPNINFFKGTPGCYIACHSGNPDKASFSTPNNAYIIGQIRIQGRYQGSQCLPLNYETINISNEPVFTELCSKSFQCIGYSCWAGGKTGELFGLE